METDKQIVEAIQSGGKKLGRSWSVARLDDKGAAIGCATDFHREADAKIFVKGMIAEGIKYSAWCNYTMKLEW